LEMKGKVKDLTDEAFQSIAIGAKANCIISKILNVPITMKATLVK
jgi:lipoyl-dependent peroxiredoxin